LNKTTWDKLPIGLIIGLIGPSIGFLLYGLYYTLYNDISFAYFVSSVFLSNRDVTSSIISLSLLFNILPFYFFINRNLYKTGRGVLLSFFIYAIVIVYFKFF
jgi:hypothetical protein